MAKKLVNCVNTDRLPIYYIDVKDREPWGFVLIYNRKRQRYCKWCGLPKHEMHFLSVIICANLAASTFGIEVQEWLYSLMKKGRNRLQKKTTKNKKDLAKGSRDVSLSFWILSQLITLIVVN